MVPDLRGLRLPNAGEVLHAQQLTLQAMDRGEVVAWQEPAPGTSVLKKSVIAVKTVGSPSGTSVTMPNLIGLTVRQASNYLHGLKLRAVVQGSGIVRTQSHAPGVAVPRGALCVLQCEPSRLAGTRLY